MINSTNVRNETFLNDLERIQARMTRAQGQLSSGLRIREASDAPDQIGALLQSRAGYAAAAQASSNLSAAREEIHTSEVALQNGIQLLERLRVLSAQAQTGTVTSESRQILAEEAKGIMQQIVDIANSTFNGRHLFAGNADQVPPFQLDPVQPDGVAPYAGSAATREVLNTAGHPIALHRSGSEIFQSADPAKNVFASANALRLAISSGDAAALAAADSNISGALTHLNTTLAWYGQAESSVSFSFDQAQTHLLGWQTRIAGIEEADLAQAILELETAQTSQEAALQAKAQEDRRTIFDFIR